MSATLYWLEARHSSYPGEGKGRDEGQRTRRGKNKVLSPQAVNLQSCLTSY